MIVNGQGEEIAAFAGFLLDHSRDQHDGLAHADHDSAISLTGDFPRLEFYCVFTVLEFFRDGRWECHSYPFASLLTETESTNEVTVTLNISTFEVVQQFAALAHHSQQALTRMMVMDMGLEVFG